MATLIDLNAFAATRERPATGTSAPFGRSAAILLFTGIRYERIEDEPAEPAPRAVRKRVEA